MRICHFLRIVVCLVVSAFSKICAQGTIDTTPYFITDSVTNTTTDWSQFIGFGDTVAPGGMVVESIDKKEYLRYKQRYSNPLRIDSNLISFTDSSFSIHTATGLRNFSTLVSDEKPWAEYHGWLSKLRLHVLTLIDGQNEIGTLLLIDGESGKYFYIESGWDNPCAPPISSPAGNALLTFASTTYEYNQSLIQIYRVVRSHGHYKLKLVHTEEIYNKTIDEIVWIDELNFSIQFSETHDPDNYDTVTEEKQYIKAMFKK